MGKTVTGQARWYLVAHACLHTFSRKRIRCSLFHIINPLSKLVWVLARPFFPTFCMFMDLDYILGPKPLKRELGQTPSILTSHLVKKPYKQLAEWRRHSENVHDDNAKQWSKPPDVALVTMPLRNLEKALK